VGTVAGILAMFFGLWELITISVTCMLIAVLMMLEGFVMVLLEAPCLCPFLDFAQLPSKYMENRPHWIRATIYLLFAAIPFLSCPGPTSFMGCGLIVITSGIYLLMALGKKASADEMRMKAVVINQAATTTATGNSTVTTSPTANLVENEELPKANPLPPSSMFGPTPAGWTSPPAYDLPRSTVQQPQFPPQHLPPFGQSTTGSTVTY